jgi:hypothetical protein
MMARHSISLDDGLTLEETVSPQTMRSRYYRARMEVLLQVCWNYQRVMQTSFDSILAFTIDLDSSSVDARQQRVQNITALDKISNKLKDCMEVNMVLQKLMRDLLDQAEQLLPKTTTDRVAFRAQHGN